jgi:acyl-coenzyme A synthetase/AMP-(fatty) acid ligase
VIGAGLFVHNAEGRFNAKLTLELLTTKGVTVFCAPPTVYRMLVLEDLTKYDFSGLKHVTSAGEPLNPEVIKVWYDATGKTIHEGYGQTETTVLIANYPFMSVKPGSMGKPIPDLTIDILDEDFRPVNTGEVGFICVKMDDKKPVGIFESYLEDPDENAGLSAWWYNTGDKAVKDDEGYSPSVGRGDDILRHQATVSALRGRERNPGTSCRAENAVVASPTIRGENVKAFIVLAPAQAIGQACQEIQEFVKSGPRRQVPREIEFMDELPKTVSGRLTAVLRSGDRKEAGEERFERAKA